LVEGVVVHLVPQDERREGLGAAEIAVDVAVQ
jgi:hypothetical protein